MLLISLLGLGAELSRTSVAVTEGFIICRSHGWLSRARRIPRAELKGFRLGSAAGKGMRLVLLTTSVPIVLGPWETAFVYRLGRRCERLAETIAVDRVET